MTFMKILPNPRELMSRHEANQFLEKYILDIHQCIQAGWEAWKSIQLNSPNESSDLQSNSQACIVHDSIVAEARRRFAEYEPDVQCIDTKGLFLVNFENRIIMRFKKLDKQSRSSNIETEQQRKFWFNLTLPGIPPVTYLTAGYILDELSARIDHLQIVRQTGKRTEWIIDLGVTSAEHIEEIPVQEELFTARRRVVSKTSKERTAGDQ